MSVSAPEQLRHVAQLLLQQTTPSRRANGRGRPESYRASKAEIAQCGRQLAEMVLAYLDGNLPDVPRELPF